MEKFKEFQATKNFKLYENSNFNENIDIDINYGQAVFEYHVYSKRDKKIVAEIAICHVMGENRSMFYTAFNNGTDFESYDLEKVEKLLFKEMIEYTK